MNILILKGFNNYFNRIVKKYSTLEDYRENSKESIDWGNINFDPSDGINTSLVVGGPTQRDQDGNPLAWEFSGSPDYLVQYDEDDEILGRWFVMDASRLRNGQYKLTLKRDTVAENIDIILKSPCIIKKGMVTDTTNPLLYTSEGNTYNQIKTTETPLMDFSKCSWLVGYIQKTDPEKSFEDKAIDVKTYYSGDPSKTALNAEDLPIFDSIEFPDKAATAHYTAINNVFNFRYSLACAPEGFPDGEGLPDRNTYYKFKNDFYILLAILQIDNNRNITHKEAGLGYGNDYLRPYNWLFVDKKPYTGVVEGIKIQTSKGNNENIIDAGLVGPFGIFAPNMVKTLLEDGEEDVNLMEYETEISNLLQNNDSAAYSAFNTLRNKLYNYFPDAIEDYENTLVKYKDDYYRITKVPYEVDGKAQYDEYNYTPLRNSVDPMTTLARNLIAYSNYVLNDQYPTTVSTCVAIPYYTYKATKVNYQTTQVTIPSTRNHVTDEIFDMFAIPYIPEQYRETQSVKVYNGSGSLAIPAYDNDVALSAARAILTTGGAGTGWAYDLQLLPYCPFNKSDIYDEGDGGLSLGNLNEGVDYAYVSSPDSLPLSILFFPTRSNFSIDIPIRIDHDNFDNSLPDYINRKVEDETDFYRITSPNFNGSFEFKMSRMFDPVLSLSVDCTYKPYNPYIKLNPAFSGLYGKDWNDSTGLICGGDFSVSLLSDQWKNYQMNNKNYQAIFDRQIQNMDRNNLFANITSGVTAGLGVLSGGLIGSGLSSVLGGVFGAGAGIASAAGGVGDMALQLLKQQEAKNYSIDQFKLNLGNIQAMPQTIAKSSAFTYNNKVWPILELFTCTDKEKTILVDKIKFTGMTVNAVGYLQDYISDAFPISFISGNLINLGGVEDDNHYVEDIFSEIAQGVYIRR